MDLVLLFIRSLLNLSTCQNVISLVWNGHMNALKIQQNIM